MPICEDSGATNYGFEGPCDYGFGPDFNPQAAIDLVQSPGLGGISELYGGFSESVTGEQQESPSFMDWYYNTGGNMPAFGDWRRRQNITSRLGTKKLYEERTRSIEEFEQPQSGFESFYAEGRQELLDTMSKATSDIIGETGSEIYDIGTEYTGILSSTFGQYDFAEEDIGDWSSLDPDEQFEFLEGQIEDYQEYDPSFFDTGVYDAYQQCLDDDLQDDISCAEIALGIGG